MLVYLSISSILNLAGRLATGAPSKSSQVTTLSKVLNCFNLCSSLSMRACGSSEVGIGTVTEGEATSVWLCRVKGIAYGADWLGRKGGGMVGSYWTSSWGEACWVCCPSILRLNQSHGRSKLVNSNYLWIHISLIWSRVWLVWYSDQPTPKSGPGSRT